MKVLIGKRENFAYGEASLFIKAFLAPNLIEPKKTFNCRCNECGVKVQVTIFEEVESGEIWIEGPDKCKC